MEERFECMEKHFNASLNLENLTILNGRHIWLWHITSENGVLDHWLLQYEKPTMEIIDKMYGANENKKAYNAYLKKVQEIAKETTA